jgi:hypothetical protein
MADSVGERPIPWLAVSFGETPVCPSSLTLIVRRTPELTGRSLPAYLNSSTVNHFR